MLAATAALNPANSRASAAPTCGAASSGVHRYAPGAGNTVALTFDDGPGPSTPAIRSILADAHVEATFFNIGENEAARPGQVRAEHSQGFALGDHTWDHSDLTTLGRAQQAAEIDRERREQRSLVGAYSCLVRPPYGSFDATTLGLAQARNMQVWNWSVDTEDWKADGSDASGWIHRIISRAEAGGAMRHPVILMHNAAGGDPATVDALPGIIRYYKSHGYTFVDVLAHTGHPSVVSISPTSGPSSGRTRVTVTGHGFTGVRAVSFGGVDGAAVDVESSTRLVVTSPAHAAAKVIVRVITTFATSRAVSADGYRYLKA
jgi:peptidoglycan/xylan/chitin deacetylase (PgdA/CDA1 family)